MASLQQQGVKAQFGSESMTPPDSAAQTTPSSTDGNAPIKPGTACLCCRRRKLKCSRELSGCENCRKADLPCIYPTLEGGVKKKRGPYRKKDKPARQAHLDHVVRYLSDPAAHAEAERSRNRSRSRSTTPETAFGLDSDVSHLLTTKGPEQASADLVKDAISALARTSVIDGMQSSDEDEQDAARFVQPTIPMPDPNRPFMHPGARQMMELWQIFLLRVEPATKIIHIPTFQPVFCEFIDRAMPGAAQTLACSIYYVAIASCTEEECHSRFKQSKSVILQYFRQAIERAVSESHESLQLEFVQALVLYLTSLCREESGANTWAIFALVVRSAQMMGLDHDPGNEYEWYVAEIRRRIWWSICSLESRCAEDGAKKTNPLIAQLKVNLPLNINDNDLQPGVKEMPQTREGITSMSFVLVRWQIMRLMMTIQSLRREHEACGQTSADELRSLQRLEFDQTLRELDKSYLRKCHKSRAYDWVVIAMTEVMMVCMSSSRTNQC